MKRILLLGANGYIGSYLNFIFEKKYNLTLLDLNWFSRNANSKSIDFRDLSKEYLSKFDVIILLAGHSSVNMCKSDLQSSFENNVNNFIKLITKIDRQKFIYASSSSVYGNSEISLVDENYNNFYPNNFYDLSKLVIDSYVVKTNLNYYGLRFGTVNGWAPNLRIDLMINSMVSSAYVDGHIKLYVKDIMRPILGIVDLGRSIMSIIDSDLDNRGLYNLASFNSTSEEIAIKVSKILNVPIIEYSQDKIEKVLNAKLQTKAYDFSINTKKFEQRFDFKFIETIESITKNLVDGWYNCEKSSRSDLKEYF